METRTSPRHGFTLVELLVVIGIISVLISILLPSLARARETALQISCLANLRQVGQALQLYDNQYRKLPWGATGDGLQAGLWWDAASEMLGTPTRDASGKRTAFAPVLKCPGAFYPDSPMGYRVDYTGNPRAFPRADAIDPVTTWAASSPYNSRQMVLSAIKNNTDRILVWDGAQFTNWQPIDTDDKHWFAQDGAWNGTFPYAMQIDGWQWFWGHCFCEQGWQTLDWARDWYSVDVLFALGNSGDNSLAGIQTDNHDGNTLEADVWQTGMRFRHMQNSSACALFADGHAEARKIGEFTRRNLLLPLR